MFKAIWFRELAASLIIYNDNCIIMIELPLSDCFFTCYTNRLNLLLYSLVLLYVIMDTCHFIFCHPWYKASISSYIVWFGFMGFKAIFNNISVTYMYMVAVNFIGGKNRRARRKPQTCQNWQTAHIYISW